MQILSIRWCGLLMERKGIGHYGICVCSAGHFVAGRVQQIYYAPFPILLQFMLLIQLGFLIVNNRANDLLVNQRKSPEILVMDAMKIEKWHLCFLSFLSKTYHPN